ncbi:SRC kinase signaling inhibitor 1-like isoform X6 [Phycodurus eques]|uniref:SRC kinase signaling inhibitor 1-like isoform X6 n=1 Tax=Phycodurus eques TaxID=693459 RepID=UPI002ACD390B|nr:SRC kinase signaling inhibitor 1-like isoform X6 [Phycodurus eques]
MLPPQGESAPTRSGPRARSRKEKESDDLRQRCRVPPGLPPAGRRRGVDVAVAVAGPAAQVGGGRQPGGPERRPPGRRGLRRRDARQYRGLVAWGRRSRTTESDAAPQPDAERPSFLLVSRASGRHGGPRRPRRLQPRRPTAPESPARPILRQPGQAAHARRALPAAGRGDSPRAPDSRAGQPGHLAGAHRAHVPAEAHHGDPQVSQHGAADQRREPQRLLRAGGPARRWRPLRGQNLLQGARRLRDVPGTPRLAPAGQRRPQGGDSPRSRGLTSEQLCLMAAVAGGDGDGVRGEETETRERMEVMEKQIASLTGLLQRVLSRAPEDHSPDKTESASDGSGTDPGRPKKKKAVSPSGPLALMPPPSDAGRPPNVSRAQMQRHLLGLQQSTKVLRTQLSQLRNMQLSNQDCVVALLRRTEAELSVLMLDAARTHEDPLQRQRLLVEEERRKYLTQEETLAHKLQDLERWVENLQESSNVQPRSPVSQGDLRQKTQELKTLADTLDCLKSQFPGLQSKMRVVLRVEVEAVKFLKEEPHRLDALLRRCNSIRDSLSSLRRRASEKEQEDAPGQSQTSFPLSLTGNRTPGRAGEQDETPSVSFRSRVGSEKSLNAQAHVSADVTLAAERDWEEKRASLTQFSAQDINRLLEATQAELLKALPDLDFAAKTAAKPAVPPKPLVGVAGGPTAGKVQLAAQKLNSVEGAASQRGSADVGVARCRAEKASKSPPPPPPPRRTFPSALAAAVNNKSTELSAPRRQMEDVQPPEAPVKLRRRTPYDAPRPASTPPTAASSGLRDDDDGGIEKETVGGSPASVRGPTVAARLKHLEQGGRKSKEEVKAFPGSQQQVFHF